MDFVRGGGGGATRCVNLVANREAMNIKRATWKVELRSVAAFAAGTSGCPSLKSPMSYTRGYRAIVRRSKETWDGVINGLKDHHQHSNYKVRSTTRAKGKCRASALSPHTTV